MPVLGAATLELNADSAKLEQDLGRVVQRAATLGTAIGTALGQAISAGVDKLVTMVNTAITTGDELNKLSQKTGMSVENLSELRVAAQLADVSMNTLKSSVKGLYDSIAAAQKGDGKDRQAFEAIGLEIEKLKDLKPDELFRVVTEQLAKYSDGANRAAIQTAIFGGAGKELSPFINELGKTTALAKELGITMDKDTAEAAERFKDNLTISKIASEAMGNRIAQVLLPSLEKLSGFLVDNAKNTERLDTVTRAADAGMKIIATGVTVVGAAFQIAGGHVARMAAVFGAVVSGDFKGAATLAKDTFQDVGEKLGETAAQVQGIWQDAGNKVAAEADKNGEKLAAPAIKAVEKIKKARKEADAEFQAFLKIRAIEDEAGKATQDFYAKQGEGITAVTAQMAEQKKFLDETIAKIEYANAHGGMNGIVFDEDTEGFTKVNVELKKTNDFAKEMGLTFSSAFEKAVSGGEKLSAVIKGLGQDLVQIITRKLVTEPLGNALTGMLQKATGDGGMLSGLFGDLFKASGGPVEAGMPYIVGERGPELFMPNTSGMVVSNSQLAGAMGGGQTVHVHFHGVTDATSFRQNRAQISADLSSALATGRRSF